MNRIFNLVVLITLAFLTSSCSGVRRNMSYHSISNNAWNQKLRYSLGEDTLCLIVSDGSDGVLFGPAFVPAFPVFLWGQNNNAKLKIGIRFEGQNKYEIDSINIHFIINGKKEIFPTTKLLQKDDHSWIKDTGNILNTHKYFRFFSLYFDKKLTNVKQLEIRIDSLNINDVYYNIDPLILKRKSKFKYRPVFL